MSLLNVMLHSIVLCDTLDHIVALSQCLASVGFILFEPELPQFLELLNFRNCMPRLPPDVHLWFGHFREVRKCVTRLKCVSFI